MHRKAEPAPAFTDSLYSESSLVRYLADQRPIGELAHFSHCTPRIDALRGAPVAHGINACELTRSTEALLRHFSTAGLPPILGARSILFGDTRPC